MRLLIGLALSAAASAAAATPVGYALGDNGQTLVRIGDLDAASMLSGKTLTKPDGSPVSIDALDRRPATGEVFGWSDGDDTVYRIDLGTGVATPVASRPGGTNVPTIGFDFNNQIDAARVVSTAEQNLVFRPNASPVDVIGPPTVNPLLYVAGDPNFGRDPGVFANAYTNAVAAAPSTVQFVLDAKWDVLATLANNAGTLTTVGGVYMGDMALDFTDNGGFDIFSPMLGDNLAYALLTDSMGVGLFMLDLTPDAMGRIQASLLGRLGGDFGVLNGLTLVDEPDVAPVPLPAPALLLAGSLVGLAALRRREA